jgi:hypothetical protein
MLKSLKAATMPASTCSAADTVLVG